MDNTTLCEKPAVRRYWPVPLVTSYEYQYQNVNKDVNLRKSVTEFFHKKTIKWIKNNEEFKKHESQLDFLNTTEGKMHMYNLLRKFIKKSGINWYDLRDNYSIIKDYINHKL